MRRLSRLARAAMAGASSFTWPDPRGGHSRLPGRGWPPTARGVGEGTHLPVLGRVSADHPEPGKTGLPEGGETSPAPQTAEISRPEGGADSESPGALSAPAVSTAATCGRRSGAVRLVPGRARTGC